MAYANLGWCGPMTLFFLGNPKAMRLMWFMSIGLLLAGQGPQFLASQSKVHEIDVA